MNQNQLYSFSFRHCGSSFPIEILNLAATTMSTAYNNRSNRKPPGVRAMLDYFMALVMVFFGLMILFPEQILGNDYFNDSALLQGAMKWVIGFLFIFYGVFRAYRGYISSKKTGSDED